MDNEPGGNLAATIHIVDFDGTIYRGNSFHDWLLFLFFTGIASGRIGLSLRVMAALGRRLTRGNHAKLKKSVQQIWRAEIFDPVQRTSVIQRFNRWQTKKLRQDLILQIRERGGPFLLATAAPCDYMEGLRPIVGYDALLCTVYDTDNWVDNSRDNKMRGVRTWCEAYEGGRPLHRVLYTDHSDDFPLLAIVDEVVLVGESAGKAVSMIQQRFPSMPYRIVP